MRWVTHTRLGVVDMVSPGVGWGIFELAIYLFVRLANDGTYISKLVHEFLSRVVNGTFIGFRLRLFRLRLLRLFRLFQLFRLRVIRGVVVFVVGEGLEGKI